MELDEKFRFDKGGDCMKKQLQGIALILFGMLLSVSGESINNTILRSCSDVPFGFLGVCFGVVGLALMFMKDKEK